MASGGGGGHDTDINVAKLKILDEGELKKMFQELKSRPQRHVPSSRRNRDRSHLNNLHNVQMDKILCSHPPPGGTPHMKTYRDSRGYPYLHLPSVTQTAANRIDGNGREWHGGKAQMIIRDKTWKRKDQYPVVDTPSRLYIIDSLDDELFQDAVDTLFASSIIGFSSEGQMVGREGVLSWIVFSDERDVFMFDIVKLGRAAFRFGLRSILQSNDILKIVHNSQQICDCLFHQWNTRMENVIDTMAADLVFCSHNVYGRFIPKYYRSLPRLLIDYLGVGDSHIFYPRYRRTHLAEDSAVWTTRPLPDHLVVGAARNCLYLLPLNRQIEVGNMLSVNLATTILLSSLRDKDEPEANRVNLDLLPEEFHSILPDRRNDPSTKKLKIQDNIFVHQNISNSDPLCIFSKDCMHQSQVL